MERQGEWRVEGARRSERGTERREETQKPRAEQLWSCGAGRRVGPIESIGVIGSIEIEIAGQGNALFLPVWRGRSPVLRISFLGGFRVLHAGVLRCGIGALLPIRTAASLAQICASAAVHDAVCRHHT